MGTLLGATLKSLRKHHKKTGMEVALSLGKTQSYVSKIENGAIQPPEEYVNGLARLLNLRTRDKQRIRALREIEAIEAFPIDRSPNALAKRQQAIEAMEDCGTLFKTVQCAVVPGLLQTPDYARCLFRTDTSFSSDEIEAAVKARLERQRILQDTERRFVFVVSESSVRNQIAPSHVICEQIEYLIDAVSHPRITLGFLAWHARMPVIVPTGFDIHDDLYVSIDTLDGFLLVRDTRSVEAHVHLFDILERTATKGDEAIAELRRILKSISEFTRDAGAE